MNNELLVLATNYDNKANFLPYRNIGRISVMAGGITEEGVQHYSVVFYDFNGSELAKNEGFPSYDLAIQAVTNLGILIKECR